MGFFVVVPGNEGYGLSPEMRDVCQRMLTISPGRDLPAGIESLNVSVAAGNEFYPLATTYECIYFFFFESNY